MLFMIAGYSRIEVIIMFSLGHLNKGVLKVQHLVCCRHLPFLLEPYFVETLSADTTA